MRYLAPGRQYNIVLLLLLRRSNTHLEFEGSQIPEHIKLDARKPSRPFRSTLSPPPSVHPARDVDTGDPHQHRHPYHRHAKPPNAQRQTSHVIAHLSPIHVHPSVHLPTTRHASWPSISLASCKTRRADSDAEGAAP
ncbi:hypothetical protein EVG20_g1458 [Dentipellis fragilis]|uniref:Uncharacterized protein n=1 Tax=Dentipellis fragilis TaxID=205917 RepID=A0A4Y9ZCJ0_9AGAM|nr:hypothetical protein EVG20_g1458 [Dentipellis fragilis]